MKKRLITGSILLSVLIPIFTIEPLLPLFLAVMFVLAGIAAYEIVTIKREEHVPLFITITVIIITLFTMVMSSLWMGQGIVAPKYDKFLTEISKYDLFPLFALSPFLIMALFITTPKFNVELLGRSMIAIMYIGISFASVITLRLMGIRFIMFLFLITILTDTFAYLCGSKFGKRQMCKNISPKKTWEGAISGTVIATILAGLYALFYGVFKGNFNPEAHKTLLSSFSTLGDYHRAIQALILIPITCLASIFGQIGDLIGSKMKRSYGVKDFGTIFPGHGGVIDRFDSALFVSLFLVVMFMIIQIIFPIV